MPQVSFERDIIPLFRPVDIEHMKVHGVGWTTIPLCRIRKNSDKVLAILSPHDGKPPMMPPGGPIGPRTSLHCSPNGRRMGYPP